MAFNTRQYEWTDVSLFLAGRNVTGIRSVKYTEKTEKEVLYAKGNKGHSIQVGNVSYDGEISLTQSEYESLRAIAPEGKVSRLTLDIVVSYGQFGDVVITDVIKSASFTEAGKELKQGDKFMDIKLPFIALDVVRA